MTKMSSMADLALLSSMGNSWQWVDNNNGEGDGWAPEGNPTYKWNQYEKPPVEIGEKKIVAGGMAFDPMIFEDGKDRPSQEVSDRIVTFTLPILGRVQYLKNLQGFLQSMVVVTYWIYGSWSLFTLILLPHYREANISATLLLWYGIVSLLCILCFVRATTQNPGRIPIGKMEKPLPKEQLEDPEDDQYCTRCLQHRPRFAHHCSTCNQCVLRMDHHCPWINNCVGEDNRYLFTQLVMYAALMSGTALFLLLLDSYYLPPLSHSIADKDVFALHYRYDLKVVCYILSSLMLGGGGGLFLTQTCLMRYDMATIDFYKIQRDFQRSGKNPFRDGFPWPESKRPLRLAFNDYCGTKYFICYFNPCRKRIHVSDTKPTHIV